MGLSASTVLWVGFRAALERCVWLVFWLFGPRDCFPLKVIELLMVSLWTNLPSVSNNICFSFSKVCFRNLSLDHFSNLGNICPHGVCYWEVLQVERVIPLAD